MLADVFLVAGIFITVRFIHGRSFRTLITPRPAIGWGRLFQGFVIWFVLSAVGSGVEAFLYPGRYDWTFRPAEFAAFLPLALILIPIQTSAEEFLFRAYLLQGVGLRVRNRWLLMGISGIVFMLPHLLNPEASVNYLLLSVYYFAMGAFLAYATLRDGRLELALGIHAANNLFSSLVANYKITVLPTPSLFTVNVLDAYFAVPAALVTMVAAGFLIFGFSPWKGGEAPVSQPDPPESS
jgi:uncharacterized protein